MSAIEKVIDRLPYGDGATRRRFITGLIFVSVFTGHYYAIHLPAGKPPSLQAGTLSEFVGFGKATLSAADESMVIMPSAPPVSVSENASWPPLKVKVRFVALRLSAIGSRPV